MTKFTAIAALLFLLGPSSSAAERVVGFSDPVAGPHLAQRVVVHKGDEITAIRLYSNDRTVFPQVHLALDSGSERPPRPGTIVSLVNNVSVDDGYTEVAITPYTSTSNQHIWVVVVLPDDPLEAKGLGGGPGIGVLETPTDSRSRSIYGADGVLGWYRNGALDIHPVLAEGVGGKAGLSQQSAGAQFSIAARTPGLRGTIEFAINVPGPGHTNLTVYNVAGRRVTQLVNGVLVPGRHSIPWLGRDDRGRRVATGIYFYRAKHGVAPTQTGKVLLIR